MKQMYKRFPILILLLMLALSLPVLAAVETLPAVGFYSSPSPAASALIERAVVGQADDAVTFYLSWDPAVITDVTQAGLTITDSNFNSETLTLSLVDTVTSDDGTVTVTPGSGYFRVETKIGRFRRFYGQINYQSVQISVSTGPTHLYMNDELKRGTVQYQGAEYAVDFARVGSGDALYLRMKPYMNAAKDEDLNFPLFVGAIKNYDTADASAATSDFYTCIKSIQTEMVEWYNMDGTSNSSPNGKLTEVTDYTFLGCTTKGLCFQAEAGKSFIARLVTTLVFQEPGQEEQITTFEDVYIYYPESGERFVTLPLTGADTAAALTGILESNDTLVSWLEREHGDTWAQLKNDVLLASEVPATGGEVYLNLQLPGVTYTDIVTCGLDPDGFQRKYNMYLWTVLGSADADLPTVMPGLIVTKQVTIEDVSFIANENCTMTYGGKTFTCGILAKGGTAAFGKYSSVFNCTFQGFDYGIYSTDDGVVAAREGTRFLNCDVGYLIDSGARSEGMDAMGYVDFIHCGTAFKLVSLPTGVSSFYYRVNDCNFVGNDIDIDVSQAGRFYFHRNFYGGLQNTEVLSANEQDVYYRTARVLDHNVAIVITNPRTFWENGQKKICIDPTPGLLTWIVNDEASVLAADSARLQSDLAQAEQPLAMTVVDEDEQILGTWTLDNGSQAQTFSRLRSSQTPFNAGLTFGKDASGNRTVTVRDSSLFTGQRTVLTISCTFDRAKVLFDGETVPSTTANGNVTFAVAAGGTYTIQDGGAVVHDELQDSGLMFRDYGEGCYAEATLVDDTITICAEYQSKLGVEGALLTAVYDASGKMLAATQQTAEDVSAGATPIEFQLDASGFRGAPSFTVKTFFVVGDGSFIPRSPVLFESTVSVVLSE